MKTSLKVVFDKVRVKDAWYWWVWFISCLMKQVKFWQSLHNIILRVYFCHYMLETQNLTVPDGL